MFEAPNERRYFVHKRIGGFIKRRVVPLVTGFIPGAPIVGAARALIGSARQRAPAPVLQTSFGQIALPQRTSRGAAGARASARSGAEFQAVSGAFDLPAMVPMSEMREHLTCPKGMVLGDDDLCYPKQVLRRNNRFRKWRSGPRPPVSASQAKALRSLDAARTAVAKLAKSADLKVTKKR